MSAESSVKCDKCGGNIWMVNQCENHCRPQKEISELIQDLHYILFMWKNKYYHNNRPHMDWQEVVKLRDETLKKIEALGLTCFEKDNKNE